MAELLLWEYRSIVIRIYFCIVIISPFWVDVPTARQGIRFCTKTTRAEADKQIEAAKVFGPVSLVTRVSRSSRSPVFCHFLKILGLVKKTGHPKMARLRPVDRSRAGPV